MRLSLIILLHALALTSCIHVQKDSGRPQGSKLGTSPSQSSEVRKAKGGTGFLRSKKLRARDLGVPFVGRPGLLNAITDVKGVEVGHSTII